MNTNKKLTNHTWYVLIFFFLKNYGQIPKYLSKIKIQQKTAKQLWTDRFSVIDKPFRLLTVDERDDLMNVSA